MQKRWSMNSMMLTFVDLRARARGVGAVRVRHGLRSSVAGPVARQRLLRHLRRAAGGRPDQLEDRARVSSRSSARSIPAVLARLLPVRVRGDHADPDARLGARSCELQGLDPVREPLGKCVYPVNAFLLWGGGWFAHKGAVDFSGGYVIHLSAGVSGFVAAWVIGPRLARDREIDAPNNWRWSRSAPGCSGSAGTASTEVTPTTSGRCLRGGVEHEPLHGRRVPRLGRWDYSPGASPRCWAASTG